MVCGRKEKQSFDKLRRSADLDFWVSRRVLADILQATQVAHPNEACGILLGHGNRITHCLSTPNVHPTPQTHFEIDPQALIGAHRQARTGGPDVLGYFHSHPAGRAVPSATDREMAAHDGLIWAIAADGQVRFWKDDASGFSPLSYTLFAA